MFKGALWGLRQFLVTESTLKIMKNKFYFTLKTLFVLKIFKFLSWHFGQVEKLFDQKEMVKFMTSQAGKQVIAMYAFLKIWRSKYN